MDSVIWELLIFLLWSRDIAQWLERWLSTHETLHAILSPGKKKVIMVNNSSGDLFDSLACLGSKWPLYLPDIAQAEEVEPSTSQSPGWLFSVTGFCPCYLISASLFSMLSPNGHRHQGYMHWDLAGPQFFHQTCHLSSNGLDPSMSSPKAGSDSKTRSSPASLQMGVSSPKSTSSVSKYTRESGHSEQHLWGCLCCVYCTINNWSSLPNHEGMGRMPNCPESRSHGITKHLKSVSCWVLKYWLS